MSVLVMAKFAGDTAAFRQAIVDRAGEFTAQSGGAGGWPARVAGGGTIGAAAHPVTGAGMRAAERGHREYRRHDQDWCGHADRTDRRGPDRRRGRPAGG
jgi:hypothetical protein